MKIIRIDAERPGQVIPLGIQGENNATRIEFVVSAFLAQWPGAAVVLAVMPPSGSAYPAPVVTEEGITAWTVTASDTASAGVGKCELRILKDDVVKKSVTFTTYVHESFTSTGPSPTPAPDVLTQNFVTPEMYGAVGDGVHDDAAALKAALETEKPVLLTKDLHLFTNIRTEKKNVYLDGQGRTIFLHGAEMDGNTASGGSGGRCIDINNETHDGIVEDADVVCYTENRVDVTSPAFPGPNSYHRGYISYHGFNPTPDHETYDDYTTRSWKEFRATVKNCRFVGDHTDGMVYLRLNLLCHSVVDNCEFVCTTSDGAAIGVQANYCHDVTITRVRAQNFTTNTSRSIVHTGYAISANGDGLVVSDCVLKDCKNHINIGGASQGTNGIWTTGAIISNIVLETHDTGAKTADGSNASLFQQMLDLHEGCHKPIVSNVLLIYDNAQEADNYGTLITLSCPEAVVSNVVCKFTKAWGDWARGVIAFGPLAKRMWFENLHAPGCYIYGHGWGYERGEAYDANYIREINIVGGEIGGIAGGVFNQGLLKFSLTGVKVSGTVECASLRAENCIFKNENSLYSGSQIIIGQEAFLSNCDISSYTLGGYRRSVPVIQAPDNSVYMTGCIIRKPLDVSTFKTVQTHLVNNAEWILFGLILGSQTTPDYADGDECTLDQFYLW